MSLQQAIQNNNAELIAQILTFPPRQINLTGQYSAPFDQLIPKYTIFQHSHQIQDLLDFVILYGSLLMRIQFSSSIIPSMLLFLAQQAIQEDRNLIQQKQEPVYRHMADDACLRIFNQLVNDRSGSQYFPNLVVPVANCRFLILLNLGNLATCETISMQVGQTVSDIASHQARYLFYLGRLHMYYHRFQEADTFLEKAFHTLHPFPHHQQRVLKYWIVCRLVHGSIPNFSFLEQYQMLDQFQTLLTHYIGGDIKNFQKQLDLQRDYFYVSGLYMILKSRTVLMLYRNFCKRILILFGNSRMQFSILQDLTRKYFDPDWTNQDVESMLVSLVDQRLIKGYLSHSQQIAVFAKSDPFPAAFIVS